MCACRLQRASMKSPRPSSTQQPGTGCAAAAATIALVSVVLTAGDTNAKGRVAKIIKDAFTGSEVEVSPRGAPADTMDVSSGALSGVARTWADY